MQIDPHAVFTVELPETSILGFHATSHAAGHQIEKFGFLPSKVLAECEHRELLEAADRLAIASGTYRSWLYMRSVTFTWDFASAMEHIVRGSSFGQGTQSMLAVAKAVESKGAKADKTVARRLIARLCEQQASPPVIYAVNLSELPRPIVADERQRLFQFYWEPGQPPPTSSEIEPSRIIARFNIVQSGSSGGGSTEDPGIPGKSLPSDYSKASEQ